MQFKSLASFPYSVLGSFSIARVYGSKLKIKLDKQFLLVLLIIFIWKKCIYQLFLEFAYKTLNSSHLRKVFPDFFNRTENLRQFQQKENLRAQIKNRKPLTIGTLAPLLLFNMFLLHRSLSQHLKLHFLTIDPCLYLLQMSSLHTNFMVHSFWKTL